MTSLIRKLANPSITNRPPTSEEQRDNDLAVIAWIIALLVVGLLLRDAGQNRSNSAALGDGLPEIRYPVSWFQGSNEEGLLKATNPSSPSGFNAAVNVTRISLEDGQDLGRARASWAIRQSLALENYRELDASGATVLDATPAVVVQYAYIADPSRDSAASGIPVVVQAQDILFESAGDVIVLTTAADASDWEEESEGFALIFDSLDLQLREDEGGR